MNSAILSIRSLDPLFNPSFVELDSFEAVADKINQPHPDYPLLVNKTSEILHGLKDFESFTLGDVLSVHSLIGRELFPDEIDKIGCFRKHEVKIINPDSGKIKFSPPPPFDIHSLLNSILPISKETESLEEWYAAFQTVHPFSDGNGRVGGIVYSILKFQQTGKFFSPGV